MTNAQDFANESSNVVVFFAGNGCPAGQNIALLEGTELPFDLSEMQGEVVDGVLTVANLNDGTGARGWRFTDWNSNIVYKVQVYSDAAEWEKQNAEYMAQA